MASSCFIFCAILSFGSAVSVDKAFAEESLSSDLPVSVIYNHVMHNIQAIKKIQEDMKSMASNMKKILAEIKEIKSDYPSCRAALTENNGKAGKYKINGIPLHCYLDTQGNPSFEIGHNHEKNVLVDGPERPPKRFPLVYEIDTERVILLVKIARSCSQEIFYDDCQGVWLLNNPLSNYLLDRNGENILGKKSCNCQHFAQCQNGPFPVSLKASVNDKDVLPLKVVGVGDTAYDHGCVKNCAGKLDEHTKFRIGKLKCKE